GYTTNPTVAISREIVAFNMLTPGSGYLPGSPRVTATGGTLISGGAQAVGYGVIDPVTGSFTGINIVNYGRYTGTAATGPTSATVPENAPEGAGAFIHFNTDITANRILSLGENRKLGQLILGDLSGSEIYTLTAGASGAIVNGQPETGSLTFDMGEFGGGHAFINKFQGGADVIDAPMTLMDQVNVRVTTSTLNLDSFLDGPGVLTSYGAGILALGGDNTGSTVPLWLWNRGGTGTGAQVLLEAAVGNAIGSDIRVGNVSYGNSGHAVLQLAQNRTNFDQINDRATIVFDGINGRWNYFKLLGGNETVGRLWDMNNSSVIENSEGEAAPTNAILTVGDNSLAGPDADSYIGAHMRDRSSGTLLSDQGGKLGLTKIGDGRLTLDGTVIANAIIYTGATTLQQGSLLLRNTTAFNSTITASAGTSLIFDRTTTGAWNFDELILDNNGDGGADVVKTGIGPLTLSRTSLTQAMTREFGSLSVQNGSLNLHGPAVIARDIVVAGQPGIAPDVRITGNVNVGGGIDFKGRFGFLGSTLTINALATTVRSAVPTTANPTPDNVTLLDEGVVNVAGGVRVTNADLILQGMVTQTRATGSSASSGNTVVMADVAGLAAGMTVFGAGLPAGGAKILEVNTTTRTLTLSVNATIAAETQLRFGSDGAGRITGASSITIANKPYQGLPTAASQSGSIQLINTLESNNNNRLPDNATLISKGGNFDFRNEQLNAGGLIFSEKLGMMDLQGGDLVVSAYRAALGGQSTLTFDSLNRAPGSTVQFLGKEYINGAATVNNAELGKDLRNRVLFSSAPVLSNDIIGGWALLGNDFATYDGSTGVKALPASSYALNTLFDGTAATPINSWVATSNGRINGPGATITPSGLPGGRMIINSLSLYSTGNAANYTVALGSNLMSIQSGGLVAAFGAHTINGAAPGGLTISLADGAARDLVTHIETGRTLTVNAPIVDFTATTPSNSTVTSQSQTVTVNTTVGLVAGMAVTGPGIPAGTTIAEVVSGTSITLSQPANASFTNAALTFTGGSVGLTKAGLGTMVLNGSNTYTGKTFINNGVLQINGDSRLGIAPNAPAADQITLNGGTLLSMATIPFNVNRGVTVGEAGGRIQVGNAAVNQFVVDIPAPINGIGTLELAVVANPTGIPATATTSVLNLGTEASTNVYAGGIKTDTTIVNASGTVTSSGTINILGNNVIGGLFLESAATVNLPGNNNFTKGIQILSGTLTLSGTNTFNGQAALSQPVIVTGGVLTLQSQNALGTGPLHLEMATSEVKLGGLDRTIGSIISTSNSRLTNTGAPITLTFDTQLSQTFLGNINGTGTGAITLVKKGPATLNLLNQTNIITGGVRIEE
ncbi:MAG TPA: autotransporter-associated beta strand repeat-containing protein, partial [Prosthecobacter sp.]|nr:autotransporter-associated beta strand repeat-containing protein [Prosthecobacter sp.]